MTDFPIEFHNDSPNIREMEKDLYIEAEDFLHKLAKDHSDITGAAIDIQEAAQNRSTPHTFEISVVAYVRPNNVVATEKGEDVRRMLKSALDAVGRQIRQKREKLNRDQASVKDLYVPDRYQGEVKWYNPDENYGFIRMEGHPDDVFVHQSQIKGPGDSVLAQGDRVEFDLREVQRGLEAENVVKIAQK